MDITKLSQDLFDDVALSDIIEHVNEITRDSIRNDMDANSSNHVSINNKIYFSDRINLFFVKLYEELKK